MANNSTVSTSFLEGFLRVMVVALVVILIAIPICMILEFLGVFEMLGLF